MKDLKNFDNWNNLKKNIEFNKNEILYPKHKEIRYANLGENLGFESNGKGDDFKRPVLIIKRLGSMYFVISMTTKGKGDNEFYYKIDDRYFDTKSFLTLSQFKTIDKKRFIEKIGKLEKDEFKEIKNHIKEFIF